MKETIDILLATYQGSLYLSDQINSFLSQTHPHFHLWVRDDGSSDETRSLLEGFSQKHTDKITLLPTGPRLGIRGNFSELMKASKASYAMFSDQDDVWLSHKLEISLKSLKELEKVYGKNTPLLVHTDLKVVRSDLSPLAESFWSYSKLEPDKDQLNRLLIQNVVTGCTMLMNRPLLELAQPIPDEAIMHDWWIALVAAAFGQVSYVTTPTILYRQHGNNDTGAKKCSLKEYWRLRQAGKLVDHHPRTIKQAQQFLNRYGSLLDSENRHMLEVFVSLKQLPFLKRKYALLRYQFLKHGWMRKMHQLIKF